MSDSEFEAIRQLKYAYFRLLDTKQFVALGDLLTEDATTAYESASLSHQGRQAIVEFLETSLGDPGIVHVHNGHHPELALTGKASAVGTWYLEDRVIIPAVDLVLGGTALYDDRYVKVDGEWKIGHTGYARIYEERRRHSDGRLLSFRSRFEVGSDH